METTTMPIRIAPAADTMINMGGVQQSNPAVLPGPSSFGSKQTSAAGHAGVCRVCTGASTGVHYGVQSCEGCKAFFKRAVSQYNTSKCYFGGFCLITPETRGRCKACRLQRCLVEGMALDGTKVGRGRGLRSHVHVNAGQKQPTPASTGGNSYVMMPFHGVQVWEAPSDRQAAAKSIILQTGSVISSASLSSQPLNLLQISGPSKRNVSSRESSKSRTDDSGRSTGSSNEEGSNEPPTTVGACLDRALDKEMQIYRGAAGKQYPARFSFMSNYLSLLVERNKRLEDTLGGVTEAVAFAYRGQIEDWTNFFEKNSPDQQSYLHPKPEMTIDRMVVALRDSVMSDVDSLTEFCRVLPGFTELSVREQRRRISAKYTVTWLFNRAPYVKNRELFSLIRCGTTGAQHHYGRFWMETILDSAFVGVLFDFMEEVNSLNLTLTENYLLMAVIVLQPTAQLCDQNSIRYVKFLYSHYLDALTHLFGTRRAGNFVQLRNVLVRAATIDALHAHYVSMLDFSRYPVRPVNGIEYSSALLDVPKDEEHMDEGLY